MGDWQLGTGTVQAARQCQWAWAPMLISPAHTAPTRLVVFGHHLRDAADVEGRQREGAAAAGEGACNRVWRCLGYRWCGLLCRRHSGLDGLQNDTWMGSQAPSTVKLVPTWRVVKAEGEGEGICCQVVQVHRTLGGHALESGHKHLGACGWRHKARWVAAKTVPTSRLAPARLASTVHNPWGLWFGAIHGPTMRPLSPPTYPPPHPHPPGSPCSVMFTPKGTLSLMPNWRRRKMVDRLAANSPAPSTTASSASRCLNGWGGGGLV